MTGNAFRVATARLRHVRQHFAGGDGLLGVSELQATITKRYLFIVDLIPVFLMSCAIHVHNL
jgi:hypothetical protein